RLETLLATEGSRQARIESPTRSRLRDKTERIDIEAVEQVLHAYRSGQVLGDLVFGEDIDKRIRLPVDKGDELAGALRGHVAMADGEGADMGNAPANRKLIVEQLLRQRQVDGVFGLHMVGGIVAVERLVLAGVGRAAIFDVEKIVGREVGGEAADLV